MKHYSLIFLLFFLQNGCVDDAPHDNPLDPSSESYVSTGSVSGRIIITNTNTGLSSADVWNETAAVSVTTDSNGHFSFGTLPAGAHKFIAAKQNFTNDTFTVTVQNGTGVSVIRSLNGAPIVTYQQILTRKIDQYFPSPQYFVEITATVTDPNGIAELDSVWFGVDSLRYPLTYSVTTKNFHATIYKYDFPTNSIQWLVGKPLTIVSRDLHKAVNLSAPFYVTRVIENEASPIYPSSVNNDTVKVDSLYFKWSPPNVTYNYSYSLSLSRVDAGTQTVVWTLPGVNSFYEDYAFYSHPNTPALIAGNYVWTVSMVDDFGNYGRSKESAFVIK
jgi:hypothetical protein